MDVSRTHPGQSVWPHGAEPKELHVIGEGCVGRHHCKRSSNRDASESLQLILWSDSSVLCICDRSRKACNHNRSNDHGADKHLRMIMPGKNMKLPIPHLIAHIHFTIQIPTCQAIIHDEIYLGLCKLTGLDSRKHLRAYAATEVLIWSVHHIGHYLRHEVHLWTLPTCLIRRDCYAAVSTNRHPQNAQCQSDTHPRHRITSNPHNHWPVHPHPRISVPLWSSFMIPDEWASVNPNSL